MVYSEYKIKGPYLRKDGRKHMCLVHKLNSKKLTVSYPKYLVECYLDKYLTKNETIDHIDGDKTNDTLSNFRVIDRSQHCREDSTINLDIEAICVFCNKEFCIKGSKRCQRNRKKSGPFCSRTCSGKYGAIRQYNKNILLDNITYDIEKVKVKDLLGNIESNII